VNGVLHGPAKILLGDGKLVIANYVDGLAHGLRREWREDGELIFVGFYFKGARTGKAWSRVGKSLVYFDVSTIDRSDDAAVVVPHEADTFQNNVVYGDYWPHVGVLDNVRQAHVWSLEPEDDDTCIMKIRVGHSFPVQDNYFDVKLDANIVKFQEKERTKYCRSYEDTKGTVSQKLLSWFRSLDREHFVNHSIHNVLLAVRPEMTKPVHGVQLISGLRFDMDTSSDEAPLTLEVTFFEKEKRRAYVSQAGGEDARIHFHCEFRLSFL
jgi:hypothetical protein